MLLLFLPAWMGADWATRFQYAVMAFLVMALVSFYVGGAMHWDAGLLAQNLFSGTKNPPRCEQFHGERPRPPGPGYIHNRDAAVHPVPAGTESSH